MHVGKVMLSAVVSVVLANNISESQPVTKSRDRGICVCNWNPTGQGRQRIALASFDSCADRADVGWLNFRIGATARGNTPNFTESVPVSEGLDLIIFAMVTRCCKVRYLEESDVWHRS